MNDKSNYYSLIFDILNGETRNDHVLAAYGFGEPTVWSDLEYVINLKKEAEKDGSCKCSIIKYKYFDEEAFIKVD